MAYRDQRTINKTLNNLLMYEIYLPKTKNNNNTQSKQKHIAQTYDLLVPFSYRFECQKLVLVGDPKVSAFLRVILLPGHPFLLNFSSKHLNCFPLFRLCFPFLKQLSPTIQGSEPDHEVGLEQTLFDRLIKMVSSF